MSGPATMRAYCETCDRSQTISAEDIYSPDFDFWCPTCRSVLILENDGEAPHVDEERGPFRFDAKTRTDDETPETREDAPPPPPPSTRRDARAFDAYAVLAAQLDGSVAPPETKKDDGEEPAERRNGRSTDRFRLDDVPVEQLPTKADSEDGDYVAPPFERTAAMTLTPERGVRALDARAATPPSTRSIRVDGRAPTPPSTSTRPPRIELPSPPVNRITESPARVESPNASSTSIRRATIRAAAPPWDEDEEIAKSLPETAKSIDLQVEGARPTIRASAAPLPSLDPGDDDVPALEEEKPAAAPRKQSTIRAPLPPLPNWDGGDTLWVKELAKKEPVRQDTAPIPFGDTQAIAQRAAKTAAPEPPPAPPPPPLAPLPEEEEQAQPIDDPLANMEVVETSGTRGTGSRTYERGLVQEPDLEVAKPAPPPPAPQRSTAPRGPAPDTAAFSRPRPSSASAPEAAPHVVVAATSPPVDEFEEVTRPEPKPPAPAERKSEDLDWYALIDEALPEQPTNPEDDASRVIIRLPEEMAPKNEADAEQVRTLQAKLEARVRPSLESGEHSLGLGDKTPAHASEIAQASAAAAAAALAAGDSIPGPDAPTTKLGAAARSPESAGEATTATTSPPSTISEGKDDTTQSFGKETPEGEKTSATSGPPTEALEERTTEFSHRSRSSSRLKTVKPRPGIVIESFTREDLDPGLVCARDAGSPEADHFRQLYQTIFHSRNGDSPRAILVTSATRGEGKTTVAANLAVVAARMPGRGALLIEADPRGGSLLRYFGVRAQPEGLLEALGSSGDPGRFIMQFKLGTLDVLPLGVPGSDAAELITSDRMGELVNGLRARYSNASMIIDGSSLLHAPDPLVIARHVDGVVLVVRAGETPREQVARARALLGDRIIGVVLNDVPRNA